MPKKPQNIQIVNVRIPKDVLKSLDKLVAQKIFSSRSEAVREFCRQYIEEVAK